MDEGSGYLFFRFHPCRFLSLLNVLFTNGWVLEVLNQSMKVQRPWHLIPVLTIDNSIALVVEEPCNLHITSKFSVSSSVLDLIRNMSAPVDSSQVVLNQTGVSLMDSQSALRSMAELLSDAEDTVSRAQGVNLRSQNTLQHLQVSVRVQGFVVCLLCVLLMQFSLSVQHLQAQLEQDQSILLPMTEMAKDVLKNITDHFLTMKESKKVQWANIS